jgi:methylthioribose-1-phosphate isomerase
VGRRHLTPKDAHAVSGDGDLQPEQIVRLEDDNVVLLDQRRLPEEEVELECRSAAEVAEAIRALAVRGAPAIGIAAAYGYALAGARGEDLDQAAAALLAARPTAVNLAWAIGEMRSAEGDLAERARTLHREEVERCRRMGEHAAELLLPGSRALTHCNTGGLATGGYGTALGALRAAWEKGLLEHVWVTETRPLLQGSRLTAWELERARIPHTVVADAAAGLLMARGDVSAVVTGADRIAANGDTANKIGTYALAVLAAHHRIPFSVVAPSSSVDLATSTGGAIPIEERAPEEITSRFAARNPAFDVTPAELIAAIVTEAGVHRSPYEESLAELQPGPASASSASWGGAGKGGKRAARSTVHNQHGQAPRAQDPAASDVRRGRSRASPGGSCTDQEGEA